jgi:hypothetical protein
MDLIQGLSAAAAAIGIAKDLREIDRNVDEADYKNKLADLLNALADTKIALADAKEKIASIEAKLDHATSGDVCPKCRTGRLNLTGNRPQHFGGLGNLGVEVWTFSCNLEDCDFTSDRIHDPQGLTQKFVSRK